VYRVLHIKRQRQAHVDAGAKKVVISAPAGNDLPTEFLEQMKVFLSERYFISAASCNKTVLAPLEDAAPE
jgi:glyceraldehyde 3-phosphate dehydrogenase